MALCWIVLAYFIGAIPCGYLIGRIFYGIDLRTRGSGNIGATNAYRELGIFPALIVFICDSAKGYLAVWLGDVSPLVALLCATAVIIGNDWSVFLKFKSGKGVACCVGAFTYICPSATIIAFIVWILVFIGTRIVSLASIIAAPVVVVVLLFTNMPVEYVIFSMIAAIIVVGKHHTNIKRLLRGEEKKISREKR